MAIIGVHAMIYSKNADADRAFLRDVLGFKHIDAGDGWLIFALPPTEAGVHPHDKNDEHELYLMTDDVKAETERLGKLGYVCASVQDQGYGLVTSVPLPGGGKLGLYEPRHPMAHG